MRIFTPTGAHRALPSKPSYSPPTGRQRDILGEYNHDEPMSSIIEQATITPPPSMPILSRSELNRLSASTHDPALRCAQYRERQ